MGKVRKKKTVEVEILERWKEDWMTPDVYCKLYQDKDWTPDNMLLLREHIRGIFPFVKFEPK